MKVIRNDKPLTFGDLDCGDVFYVNSDCSREIMMKIRSHLRDDCPAIDLEDGCMYYFSDDDLVTKLSAILTVE